MRPLYGSINSDGLWFDGKDWRKWSDELPKDWLRIDDTLRRANDYNCHPDGVFECPRCRNPHNLPHNYDYLCDGCVHTLMAPGNPNRATKEMIDGIKAWNAYKQQAPWGSHPLIAARIKERAKLALTNIQITIDN